MHPDYTPKDIERFWSKVAIAGPDDCWEWTASRQKQGYGQFKFINKIKKAHRLAYEFCIGLIPDGLDVLHSCDNPPCCNPAHLWIGTHLDNMHDMAQKNRQIVLYGERIGTHKLTEIQIREIRTRYAQGDISLQELANDYHVDKTNISCIIRHKTWRHIP